MKGTQKLLSVGMVMLVLCLSLTMVGCNKQEENEIVPEKEVEALEPETPVVDEKETTKKSGLTTNDIISRFSDPKYYVLEYTREMIEPIAQKHILEGSINRIIHITDQSSDVVIYAYVYEFEKEADAITFEENRRVFVSSTKNGNCLRFGKTVVFGNCELIPTLL